MDKEIKLETKLVGSIEGKFYVPSYQRGYRWGKDEVTRLLNDVYSNGSESYCLQPVVVRRNGEVFELIDGQQRLTTIYLIYRFMYDASNGFMDEPNFSLIYETRPRSEEFLLTIDSSMKEDNIDFWFICNAYEAIREWFTEKGKKSALTNINKYFDENVKIIWYEVDESEDAIALFARLNIGKIPLTSAELVKAIFLSETTGQQELDLNRREEKSLQWDNIEKELHNDALWYFLSNDRKTKYQTRIDLVLDLIAQKQLDNKEQYFTFFYFDNRRKTESLDAMWQDIQHSFLILKDWFENHELYHKIGYLITAVPEASMLQNLFDQAKGKTKAQFNSYLDQQICESIRINTNYAELSYEKSADYKRISKLLLLFNVMSVMKNGEQTQWFPFDKFKYDDNGKVTWSLEHIHAQQSEGLQRESQWKEWLALHLPSVISLGVGNEALVDEMQLAIDAEKLGRLEFEAIQEKVVKLLSARGSLEFMHSIANMALLNTSDNAALNNSTFDVKRNMVIKMDKEGKFIPFCTKMVFLKYYTPSENNQLQFWGQPDRIAYVSAINEVLVDYLSEAICVETEEA